MIIIRQKKIANQGEENCNCFRLEVDQTANKALFLAVEWIGEGSRRRRRRRRIITSQSRRQRDVLMVTWWVWVSIVLRKGGWRMYSSDL